MLAMKGAINFNSNGDNNYEMSMFNQIESFYCSKSHESLVENMMQQNIMSLSQIFLESKNGLSILIKSKFRNLVNICVTSK